MDLRAMYSPWQDPSVSVSVNARMYIYTEPHSNIGACDTMETVHYILFHLFVQWKASHNRLSMF